MYAVHTKLRNFFLAFGKEIGLSTQNVESCLLGLVDEDIKSLKKYWKRMKVSEQAEKHVDVVTEPSVSEEPDPQQLPGAMRKCLRIWTIWQRY